MQADELLVVSTYYTESEYALNNKQSRSDIGKQLGLLRNRLTEVGKNNF